ncbi:hypothetical protein CCHR01_13724 [Colletotrichum chrysophilum]|uniref:Uncharacterized protein n=1 Tax=Colletotrichum chrysophilum TaxID=1836956 RepID=A0AAD9A9N0_9PEZI|nr:hypothetical protein CCHR01_13724 [Colletotrichum chrysophilum]
MSFYVDCNSERPDIPGANAYIRNSLVNSRDPIKRHSPAQPHQSLVVQPLSPPRPHSWPSFEASKLAEPVDSSMPPPEAPQRPAEQSVADPTYRPPRAERARYEPGPWTATPIRSLNQSPRPAVMLQLLRTTISSLSTTASVSLWMTILFGRAVSRRQARGRPSATRRLLSMETQLVGRCESKVDSDFLPPRAGLAVSVIAAQGRMGWGLGNCLDVIMAFRAAVRTVLPVTDTLLDAWGGQVVQTRQKKKQDHSVAINFSSARSTTHSK